VSADPSYRGIPVPTAYRADPQALRVWKEGVDAVRDCVQPDPECVARYGPISGIQLYHGEEFHWHSDFHGHARPEDPLVYRQQ